MAGGLAQRLAVGGTSLNWSGSGTRYEAAWIQTGGGLSAYEALPAWQSGVTPAGGSALVRRAVPDVAFNANPYTGEYVALTLPGAATVVERLRRHQHRRAAMGRHDRRRQRDARRQRARRCWATSTRLLYKTIAAVPGTYAAAFGDVVDGTNGTCATCRAGTGFDQATGWGTPNATQLLPALSGASDAARPRPPRRRRCRAARSPARPAPR